MEFKWRGGDSVYKTLFVVRVRCSFRGVGSVAVPVGAYVILCTLPSVLHELAGGLLHAGGQTVHALFGVVAVRIRG